MAGLRKHFFQLFMFYSTCLYIIQNFPVMLKRQLEAMARNIAIPIHNFKFHEVASNKPPTGLVQSRNVERTQSVNGISSNPKDRGASLAIC
uniref:Uncharacterized protein n=1 Tax=Anguilla anguilla TaxID=7936 RepID=A0A0E9PQY4_ANGAN